MAQKHTPEQRMFIVSRLADFYTSLEVVQQFRARFPDTDCQEPDVYACDPRVVLLSPELCELFERTRAAKLAALEKTWPDLPETLRVTVLGMSRDIETLRSLRAFELASKTAAEMAKILNGFYKGKAVPTVGDSADSVPIGVIRREVVYPPEVKPEDR